MSAQAQAGPAQYDGIDEIILPYLPPNLRSDRYRTQRITSDVFNVCERLQELNPRLFINVTQDHQTHKTAFTIVEETPTGTAVVFRCNALDARVVEHVRYLLHVPLNKRFAEAERIADKYEADAAKQEQERLVEEVALPMLRDLHETGFLGPYSKGGDASRSRRAFGRG